MSAGKRTGESQRPANVVPLSPATVRILDLMFAPPHREHASRLLAEQCGSNLPFLENQDALGLERCRFAALKLSNGSVEGLRRAVELAQVDWRDLLMAADFGGDVEAHQRWFDTVVGRR